jgi:hypothetical protein
VNAKSDLSKSKEYSKNYLLENMKKSYDYWHQIYADSPINIPLIWKKALDSNAEFMTKYQKVWKDTSQKSESDFRQFLETRSNSIRESDFKKATNSVSQYWSNISASQTEFYSEILTMLEEYWKNVQKKNIE